MRIMSFRLVLSKSHMILSDGSISLTLTIIWAENGSSGLSIEIYIYIHRYAHILDLSMYFSLGRFHSRNRDDCRMYLRLQCIEKWTRNRHVI